MNNVEPITVGLPDKSQVATMQRGTFNMNMGKRNNVFSCLLHLITKIELNVKHYFGRKRHLNYLRKSELHDEGLKKDGTVDGFIRN